MGEMLLEGSGGTLRLDGDGRLFHRPFGANREDRIRYAWADVGFGGDCARRLQQHVVDHLLGRGGIVNAAREYLHNRRIEEAIYRSARDATAKVV